MMDLFIKYPANLLDFHYLWKLLFYFLEVLLIFNCIICTEQCLYFSSMFFYTQKVTAGNSSKYIRKDH